MRGGERLVRSATAAADSAWDRARTLVDAHPYLTVLLVFLGVRVGDLGLMQFVAHRDHVSLGSVLKDWDSGWFREAALHGWPAHVGLNSHHVMLQSTWAWGPAFPGLIRALATPFGLSSLPVVAVVVNLVCGAAAAVVLAASLRPSLSNRGAAAVAMLWASMPASPVFLMGYSEGMFMLLAFGAMWAALRHRYLVSGLLLVVAGLTKSTVLPFAVALGISALVAARHNASPRLRPARAVGVVALSLLAVVVWPVVTAIGLHSIHAPFEVQRAWGRSGTTGLDTWNWLYHLGGPLRQRGEGLAFVVFLVVFVAGILVWRDRRFPLFVRLVGIINPFFVTFAVGGMSTIRLALGDLSMPAITWRITKGWRGVLLTSAVLLMLRYGWLVTYVSHASGSPP